MTKVDFTNATLKKALNDAKPGGERYEISDARQRGLVIRVGATGARWQLRWNRMGTGNRLDLGAVDDWSITEARAIASKGLEALRVGTLMPNPAWVHGQRVAYKKIAPVRAEQSMPISDRIYWTFAQGRAAYLEEVKRIRRPGTYDDYRKMLSIVELKLIEKLEARSITRVRIAEIVGAIHKSGRERHAEHLAAAIRPFWTWMSEDTQIRKSHVQSGVMVGLKAPSRTLDESDDDDSDYVPPLLELGRILAIARVGALHPLISAAVELLVFSVQRRRTVVTARIADFEQTDDTEGVWIIPAAFRRSGARAGKKRTHAVPLPPPAWAAFEKAKALAEDDASPWLFPQFRPRKAGKEVTHLAESTLTRALLIMPGVVASPHDVRRSFATIGEKELGLKRSDTKSILDHAEGEATTDVTGMHYALHDGRHYKWPIMQKWADAVEPQVAAAIAADAALRNVEGLKATIANARYRRKLTPP